MKTLAMILCAAAPLFAAGPIGLMLDAKSPAGLRNQACLELRGSRSAEAIDAMRRALNDPAVRTCAATDLAKAEAIGVLTEALASEQPQLRAAAARELGGLQRPELLPVLAKVARDPNLLVATNALEGMKSYPSGTVEPFLAAIALSGGMTGSLALDRLVELHAPEALPVSRELIVKGEVTDKLSAIKALGEMGDRPDLELLRPIAEHDHDSLSSGARGFGLMPAFSLSRAAETAISRIEGRLASEPGQ